MHASTHRGGVGTPLEGTYFQAKLGNARCVQSLDDSLNSAIHITYRISLRSSSLREPRYPSTGVVLRGLWGADDRRPPKAADDARTRGVGQRGAPRDDTRRAAHALPNDASAHTLGRMPTRPQPEPPPERTHGRGHAEADPKGGPPAARKPKFARGSEWIPVMILPQVHLRKPCYDFSFL